MVPPIEHPAMARQSNSLVSGQLGPVVYYVKDGAGFVRLRAKKVKQSKATKESATLFGKSRTIGRLLRGEIVAALPGLVNNEIKNRFDNAVFQWLRVEDLGGKREKVEYLDGLEINQRTELHSRFRKKFDVDFNEKGKLQITMPGFQIPLDIAAPAGTTELQWHVLVTSCNLKNSSIIFSAHKHLEIPFTKSMVPEQRHDFDFKLTKNTLTIVAVALRYLAPRKGKLVVVAEPTWLPTAVVGTYYHG